ncbi:MAG TPA: sialidase family protein, partial [Roseiflexaceae bacterium]|nr:sialidase family protein [Roseiflexaceae bacterium]
MQDPIKAGRGIAGILLILLVAWSVLPAHAQINSWSPPFEVSPPAPVDPLANLNLPTPVVPLPTVTPTRVIGPRYGSSWFSDMAIGPNGSVHIVWYSGLGTNTPDGSIDLLMYREQRNGEWSSFNSIKSPSTGGYTVRNSIVMGRDGRLHVIYRSSGGILYSSAAVGDAYYPQAWSAPQFITTGSAYYTALAIDQQGTLHAFYSEPPPLPPTGEVLASPCANCADLFYRRSTDSGQTWSAPENLSRSEEGDNRPQVQIDSRGRIHLVWDLGVDWYAGKGVPKSGIYRRSDDGGLTWSRPVTLGLPDQVVQQTALGSDLRGNLLAVFRGVRDN